MIDKQIFYQINKVYSLSINYDNTIQSIKNYYRRAGRIKENLNILTKNKIKHILHFDISEPREIINNIPRLHLHGIIYFKTNKQIRIWLTDIIPHIAEIATIKIDTIQDINIWEKYCKKYDHITDIIPIQYKLTWNRVNKSSLSAEEGSGTKEDFGNEIQTIEILFPTSTPNLK